MSLSSWATAAAASPIRSRIPPTFPFPTCVAVGNFNGHPDVVVGNSGNNTVGILLNNGSGTFANAVTYSTGGTTPEGVAVADFNGDGSADVVVTNEASGTIGVLLNNGNGTFAAATTFSTGSSSGPWGVAVGDFNGDGKADVAVTDSSTNAVAILPNIYERTSVTLTTPNGFGFDVATGQFGPGELVAGSGGGSFSGESNAFNGYGRLYVGGSLFSPTVATYSTANSGQSLILGSGTAAGLAVSGEVTVPDTGSQDFARTVDTFTNSTGSSITTTVQIIANLGSNGATTVFDTSNGGTTVGSGRSMDRHRRQRHAGDHHLHRRPAELAADFADPRRRRPAMDLQHHGGCRGERQSGLFHHRGRHPCGGRQRGQRPGRQQRFRRPGRRLAEHERTPVAGQLRQHGDGPDAAAVAHRRRPHNRRKPLPLQRHQRRREPQQLHGHDRLGRRHLLDRDQHGKQRRPDRRRRQWRLRRPRARTSTPVRSSAPSRSVSRSATARARSLPATRVSPWRTRR